MMVELQTIHYNIMPGRMTGNTTRALHAALEEVRKGENDVIFFALNGMHIHTLMDRLIGNFLTAEEFAGATKNPMKIKFPNGRYLEFSTRENFATNHDRFRGRNNYKVIYDDYR